MFDVLCKLIDENHRVVYSEVIRSMLKLNREKASSVLISANQLTAKNQNIGSLLSAFNREDVLIPAASILEMMPALKAECEADPEKGGAYGECVIGLAKAHHPDAESIANNALLLKSWIARRSAAEALCILKGMPDPVTTAYSIESKLGAANTNPAVRQYVAVRSFIDEVDNGGLEQYFFNSAGDEYDIALKGLSEMGLNDTSKILDQACAVFGPNGPSKNRRQRQSQLKSLIQQENDFSKLDSQFYKSDKEVETKTLLFVVKNAAAFDLNGSR